VTLPNELQQAAEMLGQSLHQHELVQAYLDAVAALEADPETAARERAYQQTYEELLARQRAGERLPPAEVDAFYTLRNEVVSHPLVQARDLALNNAKGVLLNAGYDLSQELGLDYSALVLA
jgi:cell fate (sporulation/competence/biofilm development) regulator YlbF (YheA/YmcA/DUF963 family)